MKIKISLLAFILISLLTFGYPDMSRASGADTGESLPSIVLTRYSDDGMLLRHNFEQDNGIFIPWDAAELDEGFYVNAQ